MDRIIQYVKNEPVRIYSVALALLAVGTAFGLDLTGEQTTALTAFAAVLLGVGEGVRSQVTPVNKAK